MICMDGCWRPEREKCGGGGDAYPGIAGYAHLPLKRLQSTPAPGTDVSQDLYLGYLFRFRQQLLWKY
jgi:hypothetical protein